MLLIVPVQWILAALTAAVFHEFCHLAALKAWGIPVRSITVHAGGAEIDTETMTVTQELCCSLAGPVGSLILFLMIRWIPLTALCAGIQGLFNLFPVYPFDGGRVLSCILERVCPKRYETAMKWVGRVFRVMFFACALYGYFIWRLGLGSIAVALIILCRTLPRKRP